MSCVLIRSRAAIIAAFRLREEDQLRLEFALQAASRVWAHVAGFQAFCRLLINKFAAFCYYITGAMIDS